jgi:hypothetical protein
MPLQISVGREDDIPSKANAHVLRQILTEIEAVRILRQQEHRDRPHPQLKRFTQQELNDEACPTYKNWLIGRSYRLPGRSTIMCIADYLECSLHERNDLLLAAQYLPEHPYWQGDQLQHALEHAQSVMAALPYPAMVVTHTLHVQAANEFFLRLFELPPLTTIPPEQRHMAQFHFNPAFRIRDRFTFNAQAQAAWQAHTLYSIQLYKQNNILYRFDPWYRQLTEQLCGIADLRAYWEKVKEASSNHQDAPSQIFLARVATTGELRPIRIQTTLMSVSSKIYPAIFALLPVDEAARVVFASLGCSDV